MGEINLGATRESELRPGAKAREEAAARRASSGGKSSGTTTRTASDAKNTATDTELRSRLGRTFDNIADSLDSRGDEELGTIVREDGEAMAQGLVSITKPFKQFRAVLFFLLAIVEPVLAFGRVVRVILTRMADRRATRHEQQQPNPEVNGNAQT